MRFPFKKLTLLFIVLLTIIIMTSCLSGNQDSGTSSSSKIEASPELSSIADIQVSSPLTLLFETGPSAPETENPETTVYIIPDTTAVIYTTTLPIETTATPVTYTFVTETGEVIEVFDYSLVPEYSSSPYYVVNDNDPFFKEDELVTYSYEYYGELDELGRCTTCVASLGKDLLPTSPRGSISSVHPTGWHSVVYSIVDGGSLYNRSHLIAHQLTGENANEKNLITGTRYMNATGMIPFENIAAEYVKGTDNHVLYRVTPIFIEDELIARGVLMEAFSVEDSGSGVCFCVFIYNVQPGIIIDYQTGDSRLENKEDEPDIPIDYTDPDEPNVHTYVLNTSSKKFHLTTCSSVPTIKESNKEVARCERDELIALGYKPCGNCHP